MVLLIEQGLDVEQLTPFQECPHELRTVGAEHVEPVVMTLFPRKGVESVAYGPNTAIQVQRGSHSMSVQAFDEEICGRRLSRTVDTLESDQSGALADRLRHGQLLSSVEDIPKAGGDVLPRLSQSRSSTALPCTIPRHTSGGRRPVCHGT
ncbi:hypothetical protein AB0387_31075 [Streptomyces sp. NPDC089173]|uniref:hypothetical protein n=1 Tax=Streptomyces sp. NPDC089173 TaxID=3154965 RepID=UPI00344FD627